MEDGGGAVADDELLEGLGGVEEAGTGGGGGEGEGVGAGGDGVTLGLHLCGRVLRCG